MDTKICQTCEQDKPITAFKTHGKYREHVCRQCRKLALLQDGRCERCGKPAEAALCEGCKKAQLARKQRHRVNQRLQVLTHYGGNPPQCQCPGCFESHIEFLTIEHIGGWGKEHRDAVGREVYASLIKEGFPDGITVLCFNCNCSQGHYGYCPHMKAG